ncbi:shiftless antiviral inhibitor of ribosomal frameshifting protein homolog isoform X2 [Carcharodon carcharias]|uniref:shiftless antiviral inhibitor of ribosomal frameshifting protein homolog isoform X2 n=1 Tax=Carcharodon carcharias TaxID=13397 RepID=UPI001B7DE877|nr:shiftless antiviral inhibitor of ribosomal frameshifting protein homolog isoform X2 [Carcharodon carcharias]
MASPIMHQDVGEDEIELEKNIRRLRETFHARVIPKPVADSLMRRYDSDCNLVVQEIMRLRDQVDDAELGAEGPLTNDAQDSSEDNDDHDIQEIADRLRILPLTEKNLRMFDSARCSKIPGSPRLFACPCCDRSWWREVPERKKVSRCRGCKIKYDAVPRDQEWGLAEYNCQYCNNFFRSFGQMGLPAPCYRCRNVVLPNIIIPPQQNRTPLRNERRSDHGCCAEDCYNRALCSWYTLYSSQDTEDA